jgi:hypothetical protein
MGTEILRQYWHPALSALQFDHDHGHSHSHGIGWSYPAAETISRSKLKAKLLTILRELEATSKELIITAEGKSDRDEAEALIDRYFITPWVCLSEIEQQNQLSLAMQLRDGLRILEESKQD